MKMKTELNFWVMPNVGSVTRSIIEAITNEFERYRPDVRVKLTIHPWSLAWNRFMEVIKGRYPGSPPDVVQIGSTWVATLVYLGALDPVPNFLVSPGQEDKSAYIWDPGYQNDSTGEFFCVPWFIDVRVLYYRRDIFEELNISPQLLEDWKGYYQVCLEIQKYIQRKKVSLRFVAPLAIPGQKPGVLMHDLAPWIWGGGGDFCSEDLKESAFIQPASMWGCEYYFDLIHQGFMPLRDNMLPQGNFFTGHYAMQMTGSWPLDTYLDPKSPLSHKPVTEGFGVALLPAGPEGRFTFLGGSNLGVTSICGHKATAWDFVHFLSEPARQLKHARTIGAFPARLSSMENLFQNHPHAKKVFLDSLTHARRLPRLIELGSVEQVIYKMSTGVLSQIRHRAYNHKRLREMILTANNEMNTILSLHRYGSPLALAANGTLPKGI